MTPPLVSPPVAAMDHCPPPEWQGREQFVVLETGFAQGQRFIATWKAWRQDAARCQHLTFISIDAQLPSREGLQTAWSSEPDLALATQLIQEWPPLTPNLHRLSFEDGKVELLLAPGAVNAWLPELVAQIDAFHLNDFSTAYISNWPSRICKALARLAAPSATLTANSVAPQWHDPLVSAGFEWLRKGDSEPANLRARYAPRFTPRRAPSFGARRPIQKHHAIVIGAGLAGCATAWALAEKGWHSTVLDRHPAPAQEASGNPGGLFHGVVNAQDGTHARFNRAAALQVQQVVRHAIEQHAATGQINGLLRLETSLTVEHMRRSLAHLKLPADYVQALSASEASALCGLKLTQPTWFYPGGGWICPGDLARSFLARAATLTQFRGGVQIHRLQQTPSGWQVWDASDRLIDQAEVLVLANAGDAIRLLGYPAWPIQKVRGQISISPASQLTLPNLPIAGAGYLLPAVHGQAIFGATSQPGDDDPLVRTEDHTQNLAQLARLTHQQLELNPTELSGRTSWRWVAGDRLPIIGAAPHSLAPASSRPIDQPRLVPRISGLYIFSALGSRGITWSALGAQVLACAITGDPAPLEASLLDAIDPARFTARAVRRLASERSAPSPTNS